MYQDGGDDLRMLFADKIEHRLRIHKVERFDTVGALVGIQQIFQQRGGTLFAQRLDQHAAQIIVGVEAERRIFAGVFLKLLQYARHLIVGKARHVDHRTTDLLYLVGIEVFKHLGSQDISQRQHDDGAFF